MKVILAEEAKRIKNDNVNSAFFQTSVRVWPQYGRVEIRGVLKTWIGDSKPFTDIKHYILILKRENGVVTSPDKAYYWIQANVLKADKMDLRESQGWLNRGYEGAAVGAALGAGITGYNSNSAGATLGVGLAAGLVGMAADAMVEDVNYTMITDVQIAERTKATVTTDNVAALRQGTSGAKIQTSTETGNQHKYQTRVVSNANKVNLKFEEAKPVLEDQLAKSIANIL